MTTDAAPVISGASLLYLNPDLAGLCNVTTPEAAIEAFRTWASDRAHAPLEFPPFVSASGYLTYHRDTLNATKIDRIVRIARSNEGVSAPADPQFVPLIARAARVSSGSVELRIDDATYDPTAHLQAGDRVLLLRRPGRAAPGREAAYDMAARSVVAVIEAVAPPGPTTSPTIVLTEPLSAADGGGDDEEVTIVGPEISDPLRVAHVHAARFGTAAFPSSDGHGVDDVLYRALYADTRFAPTPAEFETRRTLSAILDGTSARRVRTGDDLLLRNDPTSDVVCGTLTTLGGLSIGAASFSWGGITLSGITTQPGARPTTAALIAAQTTILQTEAGNKLYLESRLSEEIDCASLTTTFATVVSELRIGSARIYESASAATTGGGLVVSSAVAARNFRTLSDARLKTDVVRSSDRIRATDFRSVLRMRVADYRLTADPSRRRRKGVLAQELERLAPRAVETIEGPRELFHGIAITDVKVVDYDHVLMMLLNAFQHLCSRRRHAIAWRRRRP